MRMDIFKKMSEEAKQNCFAQFVEIYGMDALVEDTKENSLAELMEGFECAIAFDGYLGPPDGNTLEEMADDVLRHGSDYGCDKAFVNACTQAREYLKSIGIEKPLPFAEASAWFSARENYFNDGETVCVFLATVFHISPYAYYKLKVGKIQAFMIKLLI